MFLRDKLPYHCKVPLQGQEEIILWETPVSVHVLGKEYGLLQGFSNVSSSAHLIFSDRGVLGNWCPIHLKSRAPCTLCHAHFSSVLLLTAVHGLGLLSRGSWITFWCFVPCWGPTSPSSSDSVGPFFFKLWLGFRPRSTGTCGGGGGRLEGAWDLGGAFKVDPAAMSSLGSYCLCSRPWCLPLCRRSYQGRRSQER